MAQQPFLLQAETTRRLGVARGNAFQYLIPQLPHIAVRVNKRVTRLFPTEYVTALAEFAGVKVGIRHAREFAATDEAKVIVALAQAKLQRELTRHVYLRPKQLAGFLGISVTTLTGWEKAGVFQAKRRDDGLNQNMIPTEDLQAALVWMLPQ